MKMFLRCILILLSSIYITWQDNKPPKELSRKEDMALYEKNLKEDVIPKDAIELKLIKKVPEKNEIEDKEIFFRNLLYIFVDERGHIFAPDPTLCVIYEFDEYGKYFNRYSKQGQGPGELRHPQRIYFYKNENIVMDPMQSRLTYFNKKWEYQRSVSLFGKYAVGVDNDGNIYCKNIREENIISVLDGNGKFIRSFGRLLYPEKSNSILNTFIAAIAPNGTVWVGFQAVGIIRKYTKEGKLEKEINIMDYSNKYLKNKLEQNIENDKKNKRTLFIVVKGIVPINEEIIVTRGGMVSMIFRIDSKGQYEKTYYVPPKYRADRVCSHVRMSENGEEIFYVHEYDSDEDSDHSIGIYGRGKYKENWRR